MNLIDNLPRASNSTEAMAQDDDLVRLLPQGRPRSERLREWTPEVELLAKIHDLLQHLLTVDISAAGAKPPRFHRHARPVTAFQRLEEQRTRETHDRLSARLYPHKDPPGR